MDPSGQDGESEQHKESQERSWSEVENEIARHCKLDIWQICQACLYCLLASKRGTICPVEPAAPQPRRRRVD